MNDQKVQLRRGRNWDRASRSGREVVIIIIDRIYPVRGDETLQGSCQGVVLKSRAGIGIRIGPNAPALIPIGQIGSVETKEWVASIEIAVSREREPNPTKIGINGSQVTQTYLKLGGAVLR